MSLTEEQLKQRLSFVTGSDAAVICGVSPFGNIIDLWRIKCGLAEQEDISHLPSVKAGNYLESAVAQWFSDETQKPCEIDANFQIHKSIPWMGGNIDRKISNESAILECKTTSRDDNWGDFGDNTIPDYYLCQVAHYAAVCDVERVYIAVLIRGTDFRWYTYDRNPRLEETIIAKEKTFWECVKTETPPEPRTAEEVISLYDTAEAESTMIADDIIEDEIQAIKHCRDEIKRLEEEKEKKETWLKSLMKEKEILLSSDGKMKLATWKNAKAPIRFNAKKFAEENEKLYEQYLITGNTSRRFLIK